MLKQDNEPLSIQKCKIKASEKSARRLGRNIGTGRDGGFGLALWIRYAK